ncbi:MAG: TIGR00282 family metallophosphoesterase [Synergistaceae bacterium]|jgi:metallophosphoesterase (TIGR00282 family)|nr:TIGR00282 family metallophosphoesterase [Synergistaceae bacterium]
MKILFIGDICGRPGRNALRNLLPSLRNSEGPFDFVVANCENAAAGFGMTERIMDELFSLGIDAMTSGNHIWDKKEFAAVLDREPKVLRPANYPQGAPGAGYCVVERGGARLGVLNLMGRAFMAPVDCPFRTADSVLAASGEMAVLVDFHAEATAEKIALGRYLDGRVSLFAGTHTHVQTADETILPGGTAYITDAGMTGGHGGVIGNSYDSVMPKFLYGIPSKFETENSHPMVEGVAAEIDGETGRALAIRRISVKDDSQ